MQESGPQMILQIHIILCTGNVEPTQLISIIISLLSITVAACKAYFIQRDQRRADSEPTAHMISRCIA